MPRVTRTVPRSRRSQAILASGFLAASIALTLAAQSAPQPQAPPVPNKTALAQNYGKLPLSFEANQGQADPQVKFISRGQGYSLFLTDSAAVLSLSEAPKTTHGATSATRAATPPGRLVKGHDFTHADQANQTKGASAPEATLPQADTIRMELAGASKSIAVTGTDPLPGTANYFLGNDPSKWHSNVPTFAKVQYKSVYPGIDLVYYGNQSQLEYDFIVAPHADPSRIALQFEGATKLKRTQTGDLEVIAKDGQIAFHKPEIYQTKDGHREPVEGQFTLAAHHSIRFQIGRYDTNQPLIIDPTLAYSTYLGGSSSDQTSAIAVDSSGSAYITGFTEGTDFPLSHAYQSTDTEPKAGTTAFVAKFSPDGKSLVYSTYLGGSGYADGTGGNDEGTAITVDSTGAAYICGITGSPDFPTTAGAFQTVNGTAVNDQESPFVTKLNASGSALVYSTFLSGSGDTNGDDDSATGIAIDPSGNAYISGSTYSSDFPTKNPIQSTNKGQLDPNNPTPNGFVTKLNPAGSALIYSTYLGGSSTVPSEGDGLTGIAIDSAGNAYVTGGAYSENFPIAGSAYQTSNRQGPNSGSNAVVSKINTTGSALVYSTYIGGTTNYALSDGNPISDVNGDAALIIAVDAQGYAYITGETDSSDFPTTSGAFQVASRAEASQAVSAFVTKLNPAGSGLVYSTYLSGSTFSGNYQGIGPPGDTAYGIAVDSTGDAYLTGVAASSDFPVTSGAFQTGPNDPTVNGFNGFSGFFTELNPTGTGLVYSTYLGGHGQLEDFAGTGQSSGLVNAGDISFGIALDSTGEAYLTGEAGSPDFPTTVGAFQDLNKTYEGYTAFVAKFGSGTAASLNPATYTRLTSNHNPQTGSQPVTFTATVNPSYSTQTPTGTVSFTVDGGTPVARTLSSGVAAFTTSTFSSPVSVITAVYSGDTTFVGSRTLLFQVIEQSPPASIEVVSGSGQSAKVGTAFANPLTVTVVDSSSAPVSGATVTFAGGNLTFSSTTAITAADGTASVIATPTAVGSLTATATTPAASTPAAFSLTGLGATAATPTFSPAAGTYTTAQTVTFSDTTPGAIIYCTADGTTPTTASTKCTSPIVVSNTTTIKAIAVATGYSNSAVATATYTITAPAPTVSLTPASLTFASTAIGSTSAAQTVTLKNTGTSSVTLTGITFTGTNPTAFTKTTTCGASLAASATCTISISFAPTSAGTLTASLAVADNATGSPQTVALTGTGTTPASGTVTASPTTLTFPTTITNATSPVQVVTLTNTGTTAVTAKSYTITGTNASSFLLSNKTCGTTIAAGASCTISIAFRPTAAGTLTASLLATDNAAGSPQSVALTGTGQLPPTVTVTPNKLTFPATTLGSAATPQVITVKNIGTATVTVQSYKFTGTNAANFTLSAKTCTTSLAAGASCTLTVTFKPTAAGTLTASLVASDSSPGSPQTIALTGTGVTQPTVSLSPSTLTFPATKVGAKSATQTVTLTNTGQTALTIHSFTFTGTNASSFLIASKTCGTSLAVGANCTLSVEFKPATTGSLTAKLSVSDNAVGSPQTTTLSGTGQ